MLVVNAEHIIPFVISYKFLFIKSPIIITEFLHLGKLYNLSKTLALTFYMIYMNRRSMNVAMLMQIFFPMEKSFFSNFRKKNQ